jgi:hypothetical protein
MSSYGISSRYPAGHPAGYPVIFSIRYPTGYPARQIRIPDIRKGRIIRRDTASGASLVLENNNNGSFSHPYISCSS